MQIYIHEEERNIQEVNSNNNKKQNNQKKKEKEQRYVISSPELPRGQEEGGRASRCTPGHGVVARTCSRASNLLMVASGRDDLECGDKIILPEEAFREVSRLRLEFPSR